MRFSPSDSDLPRLFCAQTVRVEPGITMGRLIPILIRDGWTIPVALDMKDLTVGKRV